MGKALLGKPDSNSRSTRATQRSARALIHPALSPEYLEFVRTLRKKQTDAERLLWQLLRDRRLAGMKFRRQFAIDPYVVDFYCHEAKLAIELDGGQHNSPEGREKDATRAHFLADKGIRVLRFWNQEALKETESMLDAIAWALEERCGPKPL